MIIYIDGIHFINCLFFLCNMTSTHHQATQGATMENLNNQSDNPNLITAKEVLKRVHRSKSWLYTRLSKGEFPNPVRVGDRAISFVEREVDEWIQKHIAEARVEYK